LRLAPQLGSLTMSRAADDDLRTAAREWAARAVSPSSAAYDSLASARLGSADQSETAAAGARPGAGVGLNPGHHRGGESSHGGTLNGQRDPEQNREREQERERERLIGPWMPTSDVLANRLSQRFHSCALVGHSGGLLTTALGEVLDEHEVVLRVDGAPTRGFEKHVGARTTFRLVSQTTVDALLSDPTHAARVLGGGGGAKEGSGASGRGRSVKPTLLLWQPESYLSYRELRRVLPAENSLLLSPAFLFPALSTYHALGARLTAEGLAWGGHQAPPDALIAVFFLLQVCTNVNVYGVDPPTADGTGADGFDGGGAEGGGGGGGGKDTYTVGAARGVPPPQPWRHHYYSRRTEAHDRARPRDEDDDETSTGSGAGDGKSTGSRAEKGEGRKASGDHKTLNLKPWISDPESSTVNLYTLNPQP